MRNNCKVFLTLCFFNLSRALYVEDPNERGARKLIGYVNGHGHHSAVHHGEGHHGKHHPAHENSIVESKALDNLEDLGANGALQEDGLVCIEKVMMIQETEYEEVMTCIHKYQERCHATYRTVYEPHQEQECDENFRKSCTISYEDVANDEEVEICRESFVKDCDLEGDTVCEIVYETECTTLQKIHEVTDDVVNCFTEYEEKCEEVTLGLLTEQKCDKWPVKKCNVDKAQVKKYTPETQCEKIPKEMCAPAGCGHRAVLDCHKKIKTVISSKPVEECDVEPIKHCKHVTKLVPALKSVDECVNVPSEVCAMSKVKPKIVKRPTIQKWCYKPDEVEPSTVAPTESSSIASTESSSVASTDSSSVAPTTATPECTVDSQCSSGNICEEESCVEGCRLDSDCRPEWKCGGNKCYFPQGKVLLKKVQFSSQGCDECDDTLISTTLFGYRDADFPAGYKCSFDADPATAYSDNKITFDTDVALRKCYKAPLNGQVNDGEVVVRGSGDWGLSQVCVEWFDANSLLYLCNMLEQSDDGGVKTYGLQCSQVLPVLGRSRLETCDEVFESQLSI